MKSTSPVAMALRGMSSCCAVSGSCAITIPPHPRISRMPSVPSDPAPDQPALLVDFGDPQLPLDLQAALTGGRRKCPSF